MVPSSGALTALHHRPGQQAGHDGRGGRDRGPEQTVSEIHGDLRREGCATERREYANSTGGRALSVE